MVESRHKSNQFLLIFRFGTSRPVIFRCPHWLPLPVRPEHCVCTQVSPGIGSKWKNIIFVCACRLPNVPAWHMYSRVMALRCVYNVNTSFIFFGSCFGCWKITFSSIFQRNTRGTLIHTRTWHSYREKETNVLLAVVGAWIYYVVVTAFSLLWNGNSESRNALNDFFAGVYVPQAHLNIERKKKRERGGDREREREMCFTDWQLPNTHICFPLTPCPRRRAPCTLKYTTTKEPEAEKK